MAQWTPRQVLYAGLNQPGYWTFTAGEVAEMLGLPRRRVAFLADEGLVEARGPAPRAGSARKFGIVELQLFEAFRQLEKLGIAPRYLRQIASELRSLVEDYSCLPLPPGVERRYPTPQEELAGDPSETERGEGSRRFPGSLIVIWWDGKRDRLCARDMDYLRLGGEDFGGRLGLMGFSVIDLRLLLETTYQKAWDYARATQSRNVFERQALERKGEDDGDGDDE